MQTGLISIVSTIPTDAGVIIRLYPNFSDSLFGGQSGHAWISLSGSRSYFSIIFQNGTGIVKGYYANGTWTWQKLVSAVSTDTDITSQVSALSNFVLNSVHSYYHNGTEYLTIGFHNSSGTIPFNNRYSVCQLPSAYAGKTIIFLNTIGNTANNFNGNTINADVPGFYRNTDRNVVCDFHLADSVDKTRVNALQINLAVVS